MVKSYPKIVALGDSLVENAFGPHGWGAALAGDYAAKCDVLNRGLGGYNTRWILRKLKEDWYDADDPAMKGEPSEEIKLVIIDLGTNDSSKNNGQYVPLDEFKTNLTFIIRHFQTVHSSSILLLTPSTCDSAAFLAFKQQLDPSETDPGHTNDVHKEYADAVLQVAEQSGEGVVAVDLFRLFEEKVATGEFKNNELFTDGIHYTRQGYALITHAVRHTLNTQLPHLTPPCLPQAFPAFFKYGPDLVTESFIRAGLEKMAPGVDFDVAVEGFQMQRAKAAWGEKLAVPERI